MSERNLEAVRRGFAAASRGAIDPVRELLAPDVRWYAAGYADAGCRNREQAMRWMAEAISQGIRVNLVEARAIDENRVVVVLRRRPEGPSGEPPPAHAQVLTFRDGKVVEIVVYATAEKAVAAART